MPTNIRVRRLFVSSISLLSLGGSLLGAQYPAGKKEKPPVLRSIAVLEWVGEPGKPSASRVIPIAVYDGKTYQDGGIYMASPAPLAVEGDTEYQLLQNGVPQGNFDIFSAGEVDGSWYGYGVWKPIHEGAPPKLAKSKVMAQIVSDKDPDRPHFKGADHDIGNTSKQDDSKSNAPGDPKASDNPKAPGDDDKPTLKRRSNDSTTSSGSGNTQSPASSDSSSNAKKQSDDPDRPRLRKRSTQAEPGTPQEAATAVNSGDPDRPRLRRGQPETLMAADHLTGTPPNLQQMVAVSDGSYHEPHPYAFEWANPEDASKMQAALEQIAMASLAAKASPAPKATPPTATTASNKAALSHHATSQAARKQTVKTPSPQLFDEQFKAFSLDYAGGSTLVFSARTSDTAAPVRYVTLIAQPDFYGVPRVIFKQVTDAIHLDITPRLRLIDAVDTDGDNRAELIFEQRSKSDRQFAIYSVRSNRAEQVFATGSLP